MSDKNFPGDWIGTPYLKGGRTIEGCDCWGLVVLIYAEHLGKELPTFAAVPGDDQAKVSETIEAESASPEWQMVELADAQPFDVAVIWRPYKGQDGVMRWGPVHCGVVSKPGHLLHCDEDTDAVEVPFFHTSLYARSIAIYRHA